MTWEMFWKSCGSVSWGGDDFYDWMINLIWIIIVKHLYMHRIFIRIFSLFLKPISLGVLFLGGDSIVLVLDSRWCRLGFEDHLVHDGGADSAQDGSEPVHLKNEFVQNQQKITLIVNMNLLYVPSGCSSWPGWRRVRRSWRGSCSIRWMGSEKKWGSCLNYRMMTFNPSLKNMFNWHWHVPPNLKWSSMICNSQQTNGKWWSRVQ